MQIDHEIPEKTVKEKHYGFLTFDFFLDLKLLKKNYACAHTTYIQMQFNPSELSIHSRFL